MKPQRLYLFGGQESWAPADWTDSDDRVRGGASQSFFYCNAFEPVARFHGELDIKTLGGAGFASQRTTGENRTWDLSDYHGIAIDVVKSDAKRYTFILKDELLPKNPDNGREQSTVSWEYNFSVDFKFDSCESTRSVYIPFKDLRPTYRGKEKKDAKHLNLKSIKRFSIMMRSFFATQDGPFTLSIKSISAVKASLAEGLPTDVEESTRHTSKEKDNAKEFHGRLLGPGKASPWWNIVISIVIAGGILYAAYRASPILFSRL